MENAARSTKLKVMLRRHVEKLRASSKSPRSEDDAPAVSPTARLKNRLKRGRAAAKQKFMKRRKPVPSIEVAEPVELPPIEEDDFAENTDYALLAYAAAIVAAVLCDSGTGAFFCALSVVLQTFALRARIRKAFSVKKEGCTVVEKTASPCPHWQVPRVPPAMATQNTWSTLPASTFSLRGAKYIQDGLKKPSRTSFFEPFDVHVFHKTQGDQTYELPPLQPSSKCQLPTYLVFKVSVPSEAPSVRGWCPGSPCWNVVIVFKITDETRDIVDSLPQSRWPNALRLLKKWLDTANDDPLMNSRLKGIFQCRSSTSSPESPTTVFFANAHAEDAEESAGGGLPSNVPRLLRRWNGKPVLMAENASGFSRARKGISKVAKTDDRAVEISIDVGESFSYMGRAAVYMMIGSLASLDCDVCFTLEGRSIDELPEVVVGAITFSRLRLADRFKSPGHE